MESTESRGKPASPETVGRRIASARAGLGLTQAQLAELLGVSPATVSALELNTRRPSFDLLASLADVLRVSETWLVRGDQVREAAGV